MTNYFEPLHSGAAVDAVKVGRIIDGLRARTLPKPEWTHAAHLTSAAALIDELGLSGAKAEMPGLIRACNETTGVPNTDSDGYHHTLTLFFLRRINIFLTPLRNEPLPKRVTQLLASPLADRSYPLRYYSRENYFPWKRAANGRRPISNQSTNSQQLAGATSARSLIVNKN